jgi:hypothetical protein
VLLKEEASNIHVKGPKEVTQAAEENISNCLQKGLSTAGRSPRIRAQRELVTERPKWLLT